MYRLLKVEEGGWQDLFSIRRHGKQIAMAQGLVTEPKSKDDARDFCHISVGGNMYEISKTVMRSVPGSRLYRIAKDTSRGNFFERPRGAFESILAFHQTGQLHMPADLCPGAFRQEMKFWGINPDVMENCCYHRYVTFARDQQILTGFLQQTIQTEEKLEALLSDRSSRIARARARVWTILDNKDNSVVTKIYFGVATVFILIAIFATALGTLTYPVRNVTVENFEMNINNTIGLGASNIEVDMPKHFSFNRRVKRDEAEYSGTPYQEDRSGHQQIQRPGILVNSFTVDKHVDREDVRRSDDELRKDKSGIQVSDVEASLQNHILQGNHDKDKKEGIKNHQMEQNANYQQKYSKEPSSDIPKTFQDTTKTRDLQINVEETQDESLSQLKINKRSLSGKDKNVHADESVFIERTTKESQHEAVHDGVPEVKIKTMHNAIDVNDMVVKRDNDDRGKSSIAYSIPFSKSPSIGGQSMSIRNEKSQDFNHFRMQRSIADVNNITGVNENITANETDNKGQTTKGTAETTVSIENATVPSGNDTFDTFATYANSNVNNHRTQYRGTPTFDAGEKVNTADNDTEDDTGNVHRNVEQVKEIIDKILPNPPSSKILTIEAAANEEHFTYMYIEYATNIFFTCELILRLIFCPRSMKYVFSFQNVIDILVLAAVYSRSLFTYLDISEYQDNIDILLYLQMLRVLRLRRLLDNVTAYKVLCYSMKVGKNDIFLILLYVFFGVLFFSNFIYFFERNEDFPSIPEAWWWSMVTITTVGYGDMVPKTFIGKIIGSVCALSGVFMFSLIIPIFVNTFLSIYQYAEVRDRNDALVYNNNDKKQKMGNIKEQSV